MIGQAFVFAMLVARVPIGVADAGQAPPSGQVGTGSPLAEQAIAPGATSAAPADVPPATAQAGPPATADAEQGESIVVRGRGTRGDPLAGVNAATFEATQAVDNAVVGPAARIYKTKLPSPIRRGLHNFIWNLREPVVFINYLLQLKPGKAAETLGRFALNTTVGLAGVIDVAKKKPFRLPRRRNSFANTLGRYGVGPGPYLFLPLIGPTTVRDLFGTFVDQTTSPVGPVQVFRSSPYLSIPMGALSALDYRADIDSDLEEVKRSPDPYAARRRQYLAQRQAEIDRLRGRVTPPRVVPTIVAPPPVVPTVPAAVPSAP